MFTGHIPMSAANYMCVCGDSATDLEVCRGGAAWRTAIVKGPESSELQDWCSQNPATADQRAMESSYAAGIVHSLRQFGWA